MDSMKRIVVAGSYRLAVQPKPKSRWKENIPAFEPNWIVRFSIPSLAVRAESSLLPICDSCLALRRGEPTSYKENCACRRPVKEWAEARLRRLVDDWQRARIAGELAPLMPKPRLRYARFAQVYEVCGLESATDNLRALRMLLEVPTGKKAESCFLDEITPDQVRRFAALYQEYGRRGWVDRRDRAVLDEAGHELQSAAAITEARWALLRMLDPAPVLDWEHAEKWNTTIRSTLRYAKAALGLQSRGKYLAALQDEMPAFTELLSLRLPLPVPDNRIIIEPETVKAMLTDLQRLRTAEPRQWVALMLTHETGIRTIELGEVKTWWLEVEESATRSHAFTLWTGEPNPEVFLVVRNRVDEFQLKAKHSKRVRRLPLSPELVAAIEEVTGGREGSVFGLDSSKKIENLLREASAWIRRFVGDAPTQTLYIWGRKIMGTAQAHINGSTAAANALGHEDERITRAKYVRPDSVVGRITPAQRMAALGTGYSTWKPAHVA